MIRTWAKIDSKSLIVINVEQASDDWVSKYVQSNPNAVDTYILVDPLVTGLCEIGYTWNPDKGWFVSPAPFPSWLYSDDSNKWEPPISYPADDAMYLWDEETQSWVEIVLPSQLETPISE